MQRLSPARDAVTARQSGLVSSSVALRNHWCLFICFAALPGMPDLGQRLEKVAVFHALLPLFRPLWRSAWSHSANRGRSYQSLI